MAISIVQFIGSAGTCAEIPKNRTVLLEPKGYQQRGNLNAVIVRSDTRERISVTDTGGNFYSHAGGPYPVEWGKWESHFVAHDIAGGRNVVSVVAAGDGEFLEAAMLEVAGATRWEPAPLNAAQWAALEQYAAGERP